MEQDIKGIPDVDLGQVIDQLKETTDKDAVVDKKREGKADDFDLGQFKNPKDLLKSYKEIQAAFTKYAQENKSYKEQLAQAHEELELAKLGAGQTQQSNYDPQDETIEQRINRTVATQRIAEILEEEAEVNKAEFQERYAYAQMVAREYPQLSTSARGVKKLFQLGDKLRQDNLRKNAGKALESIFGEPLSEEEISKLRALVKGDKAVQQLTKQNISNAYMPDASTSTKLGSDQDRKPNYDERISESAKKGDVDGTIEALFQGVLAE